MHFFAARSKTPITRAFHGGNAREFYWSDLNVQKEYSPSIGAIDYARWVLRLNRSAYSVGAKQR